MEELAPGIIYDEDYPGVTVGAIIQPKGTLIVDAPMRADDARSWKAILLHQGRGIHRILVNMDHHHDRVLGNRSMGVNILAHVETFKTFNNRSMVFKGQNEESGSAWENHLDVVGTRWLPPNLTYEESVQIHWGGSDILIEHHPGPTDGATWVIVPDERVVFVGDTVTINQPPFLAEASLEPWIENLETLIRTKYKSYIIVAGRGGIATLDDVRWMRSFTKLVLRRMKKYSENEAPIEAMEELVEPLLEEVEFPGEKEELYRQRLRYGLKQYYLRNYIRRRQVDNENEDNL